MLQYVIIIVSKGVGQGDRKMNALLKFRSQITTEETYPYCVILEFKLECHNVDTFFDEAHEFEKNMIKGKIISTTTECLGILQIREMKSYEALDLARKGIQTL